MSAAQASYNPRHALEDDAEDLGHDVDPISFGDVDPISSGERPPHNLEAEEGVVGAALTSRRSYVYAVEAGITTDSFYNRPVHGVIWNTIVDLENAGVRATVQTVSAALRTRGLLNRVGGEQAVLRLTIVGPIGIERGAVTFQARLVVAAAIQRQLIEIGNEIVQMGYTAPADPTTALAHAQRLVEQAERLVCGLFPKASP